MLSARTKSVPALREGGTAPASAPRRLPSIRALAAAAGVHRNTAAAVYRDLERFGLVACVRGAGTFATPVPAARRDGPGQRDLRASADLAEVLSSELGRTVMSDCTGSGDALLLPLDATPPPERSVIPVAPLGAALRGLRSLRPGSTVILVSGSPRLGRLLRHTLCALHGDSVGLLRIAEERVARVPVADLHLADVLHVDHRGTDGPPGVFIPLRLLPFAGGPAG